MIPIRDSNPTKRTPAVTKVLVALNVLAFLYTVFLPYPELHSVTQRFALVPARISSGERLYTVITAMFLHGGLGHIFGNMLFLWIFGDNVEDALGHVKFLFFYFFCGTVGFLLQYLTAPFSTVPMLGASGAIAGILGSYLVLYPNARVEVIIPFFLVYTRRMVPARFMLIYWIFFQFLHGLGSLGMMGGGVAYFAHIGGFASGWALTKIFNWQPKTKSYWEW